MGEIFKTAEPRLSRNAHRRLPWRYVLLRAALDFSGVAVLFASYGFLRHLTGQHPTELPYLTGLLPLPVTLIYWWGTRTFWRWYVRRSGVEPDAPRGGPGNVYHALEAAERDRRP